MDEQPKNKAIKTLADDITRALKGESEGVQTYTKDLAHAVESNKGGMIKQVIKEQEELEKRRKPSSMSPRNQLFIVLGLILIIVAIAAVAIVRKRNAMLGIVAVSPQYKPLVFTDHAEPVPLDDLAPDKIGTSVLSLVVATGVRPGGVEGIYPTVNGKIIGLRQFTSLLGGGFDASKARTIEDNFLLGAVYYTDVDAIDVTSMQPDEDVAMPPEMTGEPVTLSNSAYFKTGTTQFIDADAKNKAVTAISSFLDGIDFATTTVNIVGTYSVERPWDQNETLAEARRKLGLDILEEVLSSKYGAQDIAAITVNSSAKGVSIHDIYTVEEIAVMNTEAQTSAIDGTQGIEFFAQAKTKPVAAPIPEPVEVTNNPHNLVHTTTISTTSGKGFFMLMKTASFSDMFSVMRTWEPKMFSELYRFADIDFTDDNKYLLTKNFVDGIVENKNARILYDNNGHIVLMYVFTSDDSVLITAHKGVVREIIQRLAGGQIGK